MLCFGKFTVAKKFMDKGGGKYQDFPWKISSPTGPKNFVRGPFCFTNFGYRKMVGVREGAGITIFRRNYFVSQYRNIS